MSIEKDNLESALGCSVGRADSDNQYYRTQDMEWLCRPTDDDPGFSGPKDGAIPAWDLVAEMEGDR